MISLKKEKMFNINSQLNKRSIVAKPRAFIKFSPKILNIHSNHTQHVRINAYIKLKNT